MLKTGLFKETMDEEDLYGDLDDDGIGQNDDLPKDLDDGSEQTPSQSDQSIDLYDEIYGVSRNKCKAVKGPEPRKDLQEASR